jgi:hypothetical protein
MGGDAGGNHLSMTIAFSPLHSGQATAIAMAAGALPCRQPFSPLHSGQATAIENAVPSFDYSYVWVHSERIFVYSSHRLAHIMRNAHPCVRVKFFEEKQSARLELAT